MGRIIESKFHPMAVKKELGSYANKLAIYEKVVATNPSIEQKEIRCLIPL